MYELSISASKHCEASQVRLTLICCSDLIFKMSDQSNLMPPSEGAFGIATPSGLTPGTRSEAEEVFSLNAMAQTDSAAPDPTEAQKAYRRPGIPRTSSYNYENALRRAQQELNENIAGAGTVASPSSSTVPFPPAGQGVVPLNYGQVGAVSTDSIKKTRSRGLSLGTLARQQSWSEEDFKRQYAEKLVEDTKPNAGYGTGAEKKAAGP
jgi:hypothetical protein